MLFRPLFHPRGGPSGLRAFPQRHVHPSLREAFQQEHERQPVSRNTTHPARVHCSASEGLENCYVAQVTVKLCLCLSLSLCSCLCLCSRYVWFFFVSGSPCLSRSDSVHVSFSAFISVSVSILFVCFVCFRDVKYPLFLFHLCHKSWEARATLSELLRHRLHLKCARFTHRRK